MNIPDDLEHRLGHGVAVSGNNGQARVRRSVFKFKSRLQRANHVIPAMDDMDRHGQPVGICQQLAVVQKSSFSRNSAPP